MKKHIIYLMLAICIVGSMSFAFGQKAETKTTPVSSLSPEMEQQVKVEYDSLMAIYDPWKAIVDYKTQEKNLNNAGATKADILNYLRELDEKYPNSAIGDSILSQIISLKIEEQSKMLYRDPQYKEKYYETLKYLLRLVDEYPKSSIADKMLFYVGGKYAGGWEEKNGKYIQPYVELVKRYPKSRFILMALYVISESAEFETEGFAPDFETRMWAYSLWRKKYDDYMFYGNIFDDPNEEAMYKDKKVVEKSKEIRDRLKQEVGISLLTNIATSIGHSLSGFFSNNESVKEINTNDENKIYKLLSPYCRDTDVFKGINPFEKYPDIKIKQFYANRDKYSYKLQLFDVERTWSADKSVLKPKRR